jgi:hypothetical protein
MRTSSRRRLGKLIAAAADVYEHEVSINGCYWPSRELITTAGDGQACGKSAS